jgi:hypothetical protein
MRERLRERLEREKGLEYIVDLINHSSKNLTMIFSTGIDTPETKAAQVDFCQELADIVNHEIIGSATNPSQ